MKKRTVPAFGVQSFLDVLYKSRALVLERNYRNVRFAFCLLGIFHGTVDESVKGVISTHTYVQTGVVCCTSLTDEDIAGFYHLRSEFLKTKTFALGFTAVL